ncbi:MAG: hypothetical protein Q8K60_00455 [Parachlamydiaceae bacterium]|nr:hypothetical protein [Parachlamydiaceae bacterium]
MNGLEDFLRNSIDITYKWKLAHFLSPEPTLPKEIITSIFNGIIDGFEKFNETKIESNIKDKIWSNITKKHLETLTKTYYLEFCNHVLGVFKEEEAKEILDQKIGNCILPDYDDRLKVAYETYIKHVQDAVLKKSHTIIQAVWREVKTDLAYCELMRIIKLINN